MPKTETDIEKRNKYGMLCGIVGIFLNLILFAGKLFAGMFSGAISITADAFNNLSDAGSSIITIAGFKMAAQRADEAFLSAEEASGPANRPEPGSRKGEFPAVFSFQRLISMSR